MSKLEPTRTYSNHTATEVLRRLLDERGVEWRGGLPTETIVTDPIDVLYVQRTDGMIHVYIRSYLTPEQAIAATLGAGTCKRVMDSIDPFAMWVCDHCGHPLDTSENFCGGCGRKVVDA